MDRGDAVNADFPATERLRVRTQITMSPADPRAGPCGVKEHPFMTRDRLPEEVAKQLKWYVYRLIDPRNGETCYVGKGKGDRVFVHARGENKGELTQDNED